MFPFLTLICVLAVGATLGHESSKCLTRNIQWTGGNSVDWPCSTTKDLYKSSGKYIGKNMIATRAAIYKDDVFLVLPRYKPGVAITLAKINLRSKHCQAILAPFPCWSLQEVGNCAALQNAIDVFLDHQGILWILDSGIVNSFEQPLRKCPPKVLAINAKSGKLVKTIDISHLTTDETRLQYVVADYSPEGRAFVYVSDAGNRAILVYDVASTRGYRLILPKVVTLGCTRRDVLYMTLIKRPDGNNYLLFSYLGSKHLFSIGTTHLQNGTARGELREVGLKEDRVIFLGTDGADAVYYRKEGESDVYKWELRNCRLSMGAVKVYEGGSCALATQVLPDHRRGGLRVLESNFPDYFRGTVGCGVNHALNLF